MATCTARRCLSDRSDSSRQSHIPEDEDSVVTQDPTALSRRRSHYTCSSRRFDSYSATCNISSRVTLHTVHTNLMLSGCPDDSPSVPVSGPFSYRMIGFSATPPTIHANGLDSGPDTEWPTSLHGSRCHSRSTLITAAYGIGCSTPRRSWCYTTWTM